MNNTFPSLLCWAFIATAISTLLQAPAPAVEGLALDGKDVVTLGKILEFSADDQAVVLTCENGEVIRLSFANEGMFRMQVAPQGSFDESLMVRFGYVKNDWPKVNYEIQEQQDQLVVTTKGLKLLINTDKFSLSISDSRGQPLLTTNQVSYGPKNTLHFDMPADEHFFGFGFMRSTLDARGKQLTWKRGYRWKEATVPFFMSTRGYGFYSNNTWEHRFDFTETSESPADGTYSVASTGGQMDWYFIHGPTFREILKQYIDLSGQSWLIPRWAFGAQYRARYMENQENLLQIAKTYREKEIPCEMMALEPGWEAVPYRMNWEWSPKRFPDPAGMIRELSQMGFQFDLWESGIAPFKNLTKEDVRRSWYDKRRKIVDQGVRMFKQDDPYPRAIKSTELLAVELSEIEITDDTYEAGELINVSNTLYTDTLFSEFRKQTNQRAVVMFHAYNASVASHRWPFQWAGDFQAGNGMINASLSGHAIVSYDIRNPYPAGWHQGFLTPFTVVDSWAYYREPWLYSAAIEESHRRYACLRSRLTPYLYSSLWQSRQEGLPIMRPMVLDYPDDTTTHQLRSQYMLGDWLMVGLADVSDSPEDEKVDHWTGVDKGREGKIYLPQGNWINYWTGEERTLDQAEWVTGSWPEYMGGMLWVKAGAIIPMGQVKNFTSEAEDEILVLDIYPHGKSSYQAYEDDGLSYDYEKGSFAITEVRCQQSSKTIKINISPRQGKYTGMPKRRSHLLKVHSPLCPRTIQLDGVELPQIAEAANHIYDMEAHGWSYDPESKKTIIKLDKNWKYTNRTVDHSPLATIPPTAKCERIVWQADAQTIEKPREIILSLPTMSLVQLTSSATSLPDDGLSQAEVDLEVVNAPDFNGQCQAVLEGPATFKNGHKRTTVRFAAGKSSLLITAGDQAGMARLKLMGKDTEESEIQIPIHGAPTRLLLDCPRQVLLAGGEDSTEVSARLFDAAGHHVTSPTSLIHFHFDGTGNQNTSAISEAVRLKDGIAKIPLPSSKSPEEVKVWAKCGDLRSDPIKIASKVGQLKVNINPPEAVELPSGGDWLPPRVSVYVSVRVDGKLARTAETRITLTIRDEHMKVLKTLEKKADQGELEFKDVTYKNRPEKYWFEISSPGFKTVRRRIFENTWKK